MEAAIAETLPKHPEQQEECQGTQNAIQEHKTGHDV
jgi:hypothetical protein